MHDKISIVQIGEINVERGTRSQCVRRFLASRTLDFVTAENFRVGDNDQFCFFANEAARQITNLNLQILFDGKAVFFPNFREALLFAVVVAENVDGIILPQPAVKLLEKFATLRLGDLRFGRAFRQRTKASRLSKCRFAAPVSDSASLRFKIQPT